MFTLKKVKTSEKKRQEHAPYTILNNRFGLQIPQEWEDQTVYRFKGPEEDGINHNIIVTIENQVDIPDLATYADMKIKAVETELQGYHELKRGQLLLNNQLPAYELVCKWCPVEAMEVYQRSIYILHNETGYILTATFSKKTWKTRGTEIDKILKSFTIPNKKQEVYLGRR
ncbi:MAG: DcrB-related protein [Deltaproteobacteria bacterium]|nr:DcrB-related protein [Deltaproteobacteria bacterium]